MKTRVSFMLAAVLLFTAHSYARTVRGTVKGEDKPLGGVLVTDGFSFVQTDHTGAYSIELNDKAEFVYIVTPKGYVADYTSGVPQFFQRLDPQKDTYAFALQHMTGDPDRYTMITMADPQIDTAEDADKLMGATLKDIQETAKAYTDVQLAGIVLGDISWDVYSHNETYYKPFAQQLPFPVYPVIGNHDYDKFAPVTDTTDYEAQYKRSFGPVYYAFQLSDAYYVVLSNMHYTGNKHYRVTLDQMPDQMHWLEQLLNSAINMGNRIYICMHCPLKFSSESGLIGGGQHLKDMLDNKFEGVILTGHMHHNNNFDIGGGIMEHNIGALCGNWWTNDYASDGTPCGYQVFEGKGREYPKWYFKATGHPKEYQFRLYQVGRVMDKPHSVVAKIWNWDEGWRVRWYQDGQLMGDMEQFFSFDPDYCEYVNGARVWDDYIPFRNNHFFATPQLKGKHEIKVEAIDHAGVTYTETINIDLPE
ncbi:MAG: calcineurin-like phosphoesterase C-terminal domain-containing protein [Paludibacteraceae bacterium]|nr:calcineurin-like phosphoesterase C-terminal domain-containing protein [Paludibacteraceae bacterium]